MLIDAQNNSVKGNRLIQNSKIALINLMKNPIASKKEKKKKGKTKWPNDEKIDQINRIKFPTKLKIGKKWRSIETMKSETE